MVTRMLSNKFQQIHKPVKDKKKWNPLRTTNKQFKRWVEHFEELLDRPAPERPPDIQPADTDLPINCDIPTKKRDQEGNQHAQERKSGRA